MVCLLQLRCRQVTSADSVRQRFWEHSFVLLMATIMVLQGNAEVVDIESNTAAEDYLDWIIFRVPHLTENAADLFA